MFGGLAVALIMLPLFDGSKWREKSPYERQLMERQGVGWGG